MTDFLVTEFIDTVRDRRVIWDLLHPDQGRNDVFNAAFSEILTIFQKKYHWCPDALIRAKLDTLENMKSKWHSLRSNFLARDAQKKRSYAQGDRSVSRRVFKWQNELAFLAKGQADQRSPEAIAMNRQLLLRRFTAEVSASLGMKTDRVCEVVDLEDDVCNEGVQQSKHDERNSTLINHDGSRMANSAGNADGANAGYVENGEALAEESSVSLSDVEVKPILPEICLHGVDEEDDSGTFSSKSAIRNRNSHWRFKRGRPSLSTMTAPSTVRGRRRFEDDYEEDIGAEEALEDDYDLRHPPRTFAPKPCNQFPSRLNEDEAFCALVYTQIVRLDSKRKRMARAAILGLLDKASSEAEDSRYQKGRRNEAIAAGSGFPVQEQTPHKGQEANEDRAHSVGLDREQVNRPEGAARLDQDCREQETMADEQPREPQGRLQPDSLLVQHRSFDNERQFQQDSLEQGQMQQEGVLQQQAHLQNQRLLEPVLTKEAAPMLYEGDQL